MIKTLHKMGIKSNHCYLAGIASVGLAFATWMTSKNIENAGMDRADRWGIFIGQWAPTLFCMGVALRIEETHGPDAQTEEEMYGHTGRQSERIRAGAGV